MPKLIELQQFDGGRSLQKITAYIGENLIPYFYGDVISAFLRLLVPYEAEGGKGCWEAKIYLRRFFFFLFPTFWPLFPWPICIDGGCPASMRAGRS